MSTLISFIPLFPKRKMTSISLSEGYSKSTKILYQNNVPWSSKMGVIPTAKINIHIQRIVQRVLFVTNIFSPQYFPLRTVDTFSKCISYFFSLLCIPSFSCDGLVYQEDQRDFAYPSSGKIQWGTHANSFMQSLLKSFVSSFLFPNPFVFGLRPSLIH